MAISFVRAQVARLATAVNAVAVTITVTAGDCIVVFIDYDNGSTLPSSVDDDASPPNAYTLQTSIVNNHSISVWATNPRATRVATTVTAHFGESVAVSKTVLVGDYSGVAALGQTNTNSATSAAGTISITTKDSNNFVIAGLGGASGANISGNTGNLRTSINNNPAGLNDNTSASPGAVVNAVTFSGSNAWYAVALELRSAILAPGDLTPGAGAPSFQQNQAVY